jgi:nucleotide-binding universal stress UspA family protein
MIGTHILVGHDGSRDTDSAFEGALDLAALARARVSVASVASPAEPPTEVETQTTIDLATGHYAPCWS